MRTLRLPAPSFSLGNLEMHWRVWDNRIKVFGLLPFFHVLAITLGPATFNAAHFQVFLTMLALGQIGYTMGYHRMLTHGSFQTYPAIRYFLCLLAIWAGQDGPIAWAAIHRKHHRHADDPKHDPHSPSPSFWHGYVGWTAGNEGLLRNRVFYQKWTGDLLKDPVLRFMDRFDLGLLLLCPLFLYALGGWNYVLWGFVIRIVAGFHIFWMLNTCSHLFGARPWKIKDNSRNNPLFGVLVFGEGWHNNHHYAPRSAQHGFKWWQIDMTWYVIWLFEKMGLVWNVVRPYRNHSKGETT
jgi:fatty-acid desaturase